jgi:hypothetical protein
MRAPAAVLVFALAACSSNTGGPGVAPDTVAFLDSLQRKTFNWFWDLTPTSNGLTPDRWPTPSFSSIAAVGFALTGYGIGVERGWITRQQAADRTLATLRFFWTSPQDSAGPNTAGYRGFYYHFLNMQTGLRFQTVELSTIDTSLLLGGVLFAQSYFTGTDTTEKEIRALADSIYYRVDWPWARNGAASVTMGWHPESGFIAARWIGYNEAMILNILALGSPTHPVDSSAWSAWTSGYDWGTYHGQSFVQFGPLFGHQYSHLWIDFRGIKDAYMQGRGIDYFENSRRATLSQRAYAIANPGAWRGYSADIWGLTACDGPANKTLTLAGRSRQFHTYWARGAGLGYENDDGTICPTAVGGAVPFAPEITIPALLAMQRTYGNKLYQTYGLLDAFNPTFTAQGQQAVGTVDPQLGWFDVDYLGIDQGPILIMIENYRTGFVWNVMKTNAHIIRGLQRAGFTGGWLP